MTNSSEFQQRLEALENTRRAILNILEDTSASKDALEESETKYRNVVENASDIIVLNDLEGKYSFVNLTAERISGFPREEFLNMDFSDIMHPQDVMNVRRLFEKQFRSKTPEIEFEARIITKSGDTKWLRTKARLVWENERIVGWQSIARDITDRKMAEEKALERQKRIMALNEASQSLSSSLNFKQVVDKCATLAIKLIDVDGTTIYLINEEKNLLEPILSKREIYAQEVMAMTMELGEGITGGVALSGQAKIVNRVDLLDIGKQVPGTPVELESLLSAPLKVKDHVIGVVTLSRLGTREFIEEDLVFLENLANISAAAIENARLYESLERSENNYRSLVETAADPVIAIDESERVVLWNSAADKTFGYTADEMLGHSLERIFPPQESFRKFKKGLKEYLITGKSQIIGVTHEVQGRHKAGGRVDFLLSVSARKTEDGWIFTSLGKDITKEKQARQEIKRLASFPHENPLPVIEVNSEGKPNYINPAGLNLLKRMKLRKAQINKILPQGYQKLVKKSLKKGIDIPPHEVYLDSSVLLWTGHLLKNLQLVHFYATDITEIKETEKELMKAKERAETSDRLKNVFLSTMSHEVRTPLNLLLGYSDLLTSTKAEKLSDDEQRFLQGIRDSGDRLKRLIDDILDVSLIEADRTVLNLQVFIADPLIKKSVSEIIISAKKNNLKVIENYQASSAHIKVDERRLGQALGNILQNAIKFTPEGSITITTNMYSNMYRVTVTDTGIGIKENFKPYLFTLFRQADEGYRRGYEGAGLGLAISIRFISAMGGRIEVESQEGEGSTFTILLPIVKHHRNKIKETTPPTKPVKNILIKKGKKNKVFPDQELKFGEKIVLIVEDNPDNLTYIEFLLNKLGFSFLSAESGEKGLVILREKLVDCVFVDISLAGGMSGIDFLNMIRKNRTFKNIPLVAVTAHAMKGQKEDFLQHGFSDYLAKPFNLKELRALMERIF